MSLTTEFVASTLTSALSHALLQGVLLCLTVTYFQSPRPNGKLFDCFVGSIGFISLLQTAEQMIKLYRVVLEGDVWYLKPYSAADPALPVAIIGLVQCFYILRVWKMLSSRMPILIGLVLLWLVSMVSGSIPVYCNAVPPTPTTTELVHITVPMWEISTLLLDLLITGILSSFLFSVRTGYSELDHVLTRIWVMLWTTAAPPAFFMLVGVVFYFRTRAFFWTIYFTNIIGKLYPISLMITLNGRNTIRQTMNAPNRLHRLSPIEDSSASAVVFARSDHIANQGENANRFSSPPVVIAKLRSDDIILGDVYTEEWKRQSSEPTRLDLSRVYSNEISDNSSHIV